MRHEDEYIHCRQRVGQLNASRLQLTGVCGCAVGRYIRRMTTPNVLIVAVDGLRASALGAYGNTTFATAALDRLAAESFLLDFCYAPSNDLRDVYRALWHSLDPLRSTGVESSEQSLPRYFSQKGFETTLVTDERELLALPAARCFDRCVEVGTSSSQFEARALDPTRTALTRLFAAACDAIRGEREPIAAGKNLSRLIWVHSRGMYGPWDAPLELQRRLLDEADPPPMESSAPPDTLLSKADDPDATFQYGCAYAAQAIVLDMCWSGLMEALASIKSGDRWLVLLMGVRGFPLGEHGRLGGIDERLYGEGLHVPWFVRFPDRHGALARSAALTSHMDLLPTLDEWSRSTERTALSAFDGMSIRPLVASSHGKPRPWRDWLLSANCSGSKALRTDAWCLRQDAPAANDAEAVSISAVGELFVRPDDRWEANDVAKLCPDVVELLARATEDVSQALREGQPLPANVMAPRAEAAE